LRNFLFDYIDEDNVNVVINSFGLSRILNEKKEYSFKDQIGLPTIQYHVSFFDNDVFLTCGSDGIINIWDKLRKGNDYMLGNTYINGK